MTEQEKLILLTNELKDYLNRTNEIYEDVRETNEEADFYTTIQPFVEEVHAKLDEWSAQAIQWLKINNAKNIYDLQIDAAKENFKEIVVQAFFPKTSYSRFKHNIHSINYIFEKLLTEIENNS